MQQISHCFKEGDCYTNHQGEEDLSMENKNQRICIIGGGPAGTSMAMYLEKKGYDNYVIYEKSGKVGGKAFSPMMKVKNAQGNGKTAPLKWARSWAATLTSQFTSAKSSAARPISTDRPWAEDL